VWPALGCVLLFFLPFAVGGIFAAARGIRVAQSGDWSQAGLLAIFALVFGGVGLGGIGAVLVGRRKAEEALALEARHPDAPWLWREDWATRRLSDTSRATMWSAWAFAALWNLVSLPSSILAVRSALHVGTNAAVIALLFPVVGVGLVAWAIRATLRYRRYGASRFDLTTLPASVGRSLEGTLRPPAGLRPLEGYRVVLSCIRRVTTGSRGDRSTSESVLWQEERRVPATAGGVPVAFAIPPDATPCDPKRGGDRTFWRLTASAEVPGVDYAATFEVPVFRTAAGDQPRTDAERAVAALDADASDYRQPAGSPIHVSTTHRGVEIYYPNARNRGMATGLTLFLAFWVFATWATVHFGAPIVFPIVFAAFGLLLLSIALDQWLGVTRVTAGDGQVTVASGWLVPRRERTLRAPEIADVTARITSQSGNTPYYDIAIVTTAGRRVPAGSAVRDKREAEWLATMIKERVVGRNL
jgi:hypothetical protein